MSSGGTHMRAGLRLLVLGACIALLAAACGDDADSLTADAGPDFTIAVGAVPSFDGCDSAGDITNYKWVVRSAPPNMASDVGKVLREVFNECSFSLVNSMVTDEVGEWTIELVVTDAEGNSRTDSVLVAVAG